VAEEAQVQVAMMPEILHGFEGTRKDFQYFPYLFKNLQELCACFRFQTHHSSSRKNLSHQAPDASNFG